MDDSLPAMIDPVRLADKGTHVAGRLPIAHMRRLAEVCLGDQGTAEVDLRFGRDPDGRRHMRGHIAVTLRLQCQRCLGELSLPIEANPDLLLVGAGATNREMPAEADWLEVEGPLPLSDLIEDELLLVLPMMPLHENASCAGTREAEGEVAAATRPNPFAVLGKLKQTNK